VEGDGVHTWQSPRIGHLRMVPHLIWFIGIFTGWAPIHPLLLQLIVPTLLGSTDVERRIANLTRNMANFTRLITRQAATSSVELFRGEVEAEGFYYEI
jgi:hypothetical protein